MHTLKRMLGLSGAASVLIALAAAMPASAAVTAEASCAVDGSATVSPSVKIGPNSGGYTFDSTTGLGLRLTCVVTAGKGKGTAQYDVQVVTATSIGTYNNISCGTGFAHSTSNDITAVGRLSGGNKDLTALTLGQDANLDYDITFAGGNGALVFRGPGDPGNAIGGGPIHITPDFGPGEPNTTDCTSGFSVVGALEGVLP